MRPLSVVRICLALLPALLCGAEQPEFTARQSTLVFRSSTSLVQVPAVVRDTNGRTVGTLGAEDFELFDNGKPQTISRFLVEKAESTERTTGVRFENPEAKSGADRAGAGANTAPARFIALLMDDVNLSAADFVRGRNAALHFVDTIRPDQRVAVYSVSGGASLDFTSDREQLRHALESVSATDRSQHESIPIGVDKPPCRLTYFNEDRAVFQGAATVGCPDGGILQVPGESITWAEIYHMMKTWGDADEEAYFALIQKLVSKMAVLPGNRSILLLSPGTYVPSRYRARFRDVLAGAQRAKVVISGVDARGVLGSGVYSASARLASHAAQDPVEIGDQVQGGDFMAELTSGTGGIYVHSDNDLDGAIRRAESTPEFIYLLGFAPAGAALDGKRHVLAVRLKNAHGFTVQARIGYFAAEASADAGADPDNNVQRQIEDAFFSSQEVKGLPVQMRTKFFREGDNATLTVIANVNAAKLAFRREGDRNLDNLTLVVGLFDQNGNFVSAIRKDMQMRLKDATLEAWLKSGLAAATDFHVTPGKYLVRLVVRDAEGASMAEQSTGVDIPW